MIGSPDRTAVPLKILILKPSSLGDVVHALPVLRLLKRQLPTSQIYWWIASNLNDLLAEDPDLAGLYSFQRRGWASLGVCRQLLQTLREIRQARFNLVLDLQGLARSGLVAWLANADRVVGLADPREGASMFYDVAVPRPSPDTHAVDWYLEVVRALGLGVDLQFTWLHGRPTSAAAIQDKWRPAGRRWVLLQPGGRWPNKRWPVDSFARLVQVLGKSDPTLQFAVLGARDEAELGARIRSARPDRVLDLTGQLSLGELIEWLRLAAVLVTNDSGPMHLAVAAGTPVVALFGPTSPRRTGPYGGRDDVLQLDLPCVPCMKSVCHVERFMQCLVDLPVERVADAVRARLGANGRLRPVWAQARLAP